MAFRVARTVATAAAAARAGLIAPLLLAFVGASAQEPVVPPALSLTCDVPPADIAAPAPLPHLEAAIAARRQIKVLAIGSSSTAGIGASSAAHNYPAQFEAILEKTFRGLDVVVQNRGVSGEVATATADRLRTIVGLDKPDLVLWQVGTNDALARLPVDDFKATVSGTVRWLKEHQIDTVLVGLQYTFAVSKDEYYAAIRRALHEIAAGENVPLVRRYEAMEYIERGKKGQLLSADELHLNDLGYRCMAEHVVRAVVVSAFLKPKRLGPGR
ncbi:MAG: lipolytic protein family [Enterovirga sp.]|jgi:acyl-CoA thioesterase-1|nr:lipolytic protein family [Enterovirga sp.]